MTSPAPSMFKTPAGQARYFAAYDATLALWPGPVEALTLSTQFGPAHVNACGPLDAPPLVLLPGAAVSSTMWYPNIAALSQTYRIYAPDLPGDMGKTISLRPLKQQAVFVDWLREILAGLGLKRVSIGGLSAGGAHALAYAAAAPERVRNLILLSPASLLPLRPQFYMRIAAAMFTPFLSAPTRQRWMLGAASPHLAPIIKQLFTPNDFQYQMFSPPVATEAMLKQIAAPTLLLLGEREIIYNPQAALKRATQFIPTLETHLIPNAGHALNFDQPELVNTRILEFLQKDKQLS